MAREDGFEMMMQKMHKEASNGVSHDIVCPNPEAMIELVQADDPRNSFARRNNLPMPGKKL